MIHNHQKCGPHSLKEAYDLEEDKGFALKSMSSNTWATRADSQYAVRAARAGGYKGRGGRKGF